MANITESSIHSRNSLGSGNITASQISQVIYQTRDDHVHDISEQKGIVSFMQVLSVYRWLVKRGKEAVASKILSKIYMKDDDKIQNKMLELQSVVNSTKEPFIQTLKFVSQWKFIQRCDMN